VTLIGNLGADPEVRSTTNGSRVATLSLATSRQWKNQSGEKQEKTEWHRVVLWNNKASNLADIAERFCKKGDKIYVEGSIEYRSWQDREGQTRYTTEINGRELILLSGRGDSGSESYTPAPRAAAAAGGKGGSGKEESIDDFPDALDGEDDDLPF
jgi:single-strand DNA-binding protein